MQRGLPAFLLVVAMLGSSADAEPTVPSPAEAARAAEARGPLPADPLRLRYSPGWAAIHVLGVDLGISIFGLALDKDYLRISPSSVWTNVSNPWRWDDDAFTTNQFGHPYLGNLAFNAARSNGTGFWGAAIYSFFGSVFWELVMETDTPSLNDQLVTPTGGVLIGEALHRLGQAIRWENGLLRGRLLAAVVDPMGAVSDWTHGDAWALTEPPPRFGYLSLGWNGVAVDFDAPSGQRFQRMMPRIHGALYQSYGIPVDARFQPRRPLDHFEFLIEGDVSGDSASASLHTRGMLWGRATPLPRGNAIGGVMASYDFANPARTRVAAVSIGLGAVAHVRLGRSWFGQGTLSAGLIPYGAAGADVLDGDTGEPSPASYHRGPGAAQEFELKLGWRGHALLYVNARGFYINGTHFAEGSEVVTYVRFGLLAGVWDPHALQLEGVLATRRGSFVDDRPDVIDSTAELRISYAYLSDFEFGGGTGP